MYSKVLEIERSFTSCPPRSVSTILSSFPTVELFFIDFSNKWPCCESFQKSVTCSPSACPLSGVQSLLLDTIYRSSTKFTPHEQPLCGTQFTHPECCGILFTAGSLFWVTHFPCMALIAFSDLSWDVDYFAFVSHLSGKGLQDCSVLWPLVLLGMTVSRPHSLGSENVWPVVWHWGYLFSKGGWCRTCGRLEVGNNGKENQRVLEFSGRSC